MKPKAPEREPWSAIRSSPTAKPDRTREVAYLALRVLAAAAVAAAGFGLLKYLERGEWTATGRIVVDPDAGIAAREMVERTLVLFGLVGLMTETLFWPLRERIRAGDLAVWTPFAWSLIGGGIFLDAGGESPKAVMLLAGGALVGFAAGAIQVTLWRAGQESHATPGRAEWPGQEPLSWIIALALLAGAFLGGLRGWTGPSPAFRSLWEYRQREWSASRPSQPIEDPPLEEPSIP